jgi:hypothetical protein
LGGKFPSFHLVIPCYTNLKCINRDFCGKNWEAFKNRVYF